MMCSCAPASRGSAAVGESKRRGSVRVDIHCHYLNPDAAAKVAHVLPGTDHPYDMGMEDPVGFIGGTPRLSAADKARILGGPRRPPAED